MRHSKVIACILSAGVSVCTLLQEFTKLFPLSCTKSISLQFSLSIAVRRHRYQTEIRFVAQCGQIEKNTALRKKQVRLPWRHVYENWNDREVEHGPYASMTCKSVTCLKERKRGKERTERKYHTVKLSPTAVMIQWMTERFLDFHRCESNLSFSWLCTEMPQSRMERASKKWHILFFPAVVLQGQAGILQPTPLELLCLHSVINFSLSSVHFVKRLIP